MRKWSRGSRLLKMKVGWLTVGIQTSNRRGFSGLNVFKCLCPNCRSPELRLLLSEPEEAGQSCDFDRKLSKTFSFFLIFPFYFPSTDGQTGGDDSAAVKSSSKGMRRVNKNICSSGYTFSLHYFNFPSCVFIFVITGILCI